MPRLVAMPSGALVLCVLVATVAGGDTHAARSPVLDQLQPLVYQLIGQVTELRDEVASLRVSRLRSDERIATLETEVHRLSTLCEQHDRTMNETTSLSRRVDELERVEGRRRMQGAEPEPEPAAAGIGDNVKIIKPHVIRCGGPGIAVGEGEFDYSRCADRTFAICHAEVCDAHSGKHRRTQIGVGHGGGGDKCNPADLPGRSDAITAACCGQLSQECSSGSPQTCSTGCASLFLPFWNECLSALGKDGQRHFEPIVALCEAVTSTGLTLAEQLNVQCSDGTPAAECVPECTENYHGFLMLLTINGDDSKLSCEMHRGLYSWVGSAADGGYLGADFEAFFAAINSGAAGLYLATLLEDAGITTDLTISPGQNASVVGDRATTPSWGFGGFALEQRSSLDLSYMYVQGAISAEVDGVLTLQHAVASSRIDVAGGLLIAESTSFGGGTPRITVDDGGTASMHSCTLSTFVQLIVTAGSFHLDSMAVPGIVLATAQRDFILRELRLSHVTMVELPNAGEMTGEMMIGEHGIGAVIDPPNWSLVGPPAFVVGSGPCTVTEGGRCVGRPDGYFPNEQCSITVGGGPGVLGPCGVFNIQDNVIVMPDGREITSASCPVGISLHPAEIISWSSASIACETTGLEPCSNDRKGGWQICFA